MDSFVLFARRVRLAAIIVLVILLLMLIPVVTLLLLAGGAAVALWMLTVVSSQVARSAGRELALTRPSYLSRPAKENRSSGRVDPDDRMDRYDDASDEYEEEPDGDRLPVMRSSRWTPSLQKLNELAARWQPETEPTYRQYLLGQAWIDLVATLTESWVRLFLFTSKVRNESERRLSGEKRSSVLFPLRWSVNIAIAATLLAAALAGIVMSAVCTLVLTLGGLAWLGGVAVLRISEAAVAWVRKITMPCQTCDRQIRLPIYECGSCGARHNQLTPNVFGALWHPCHCGKSVPTTVLMGKWQMKAYCTNPDCAIRLPRGIGRIPVRHIPILGARQAGKSTLSCLMLQHLDRHLTEGSLSFEDPRDQERLGLTGGCKFISKTTQQIGLRPALITVNHKGKRQLLYFFDPAGEDIDKPSELVQHAFISYMTTFVITLDPLTIPAVTASAGLAETPGDPLHIPSSVDVLDGLIGTLQGLGDQVGPSGPRGNGPQIKRIAVVLTKVDLLSSRQQEQILKDGRQWLADMGLRDQLETLEQLAGQVRYLTSGLPGTQPIADYATLALWISGLEDRPPGHTPGDSKLLSQSGGTGRVARGLSQQAAASAHAEPEADPRDKAPPDPQLAVSYRCGRIGLLALATAGAACSWFVVLDMLFSDIYQLVH